MLSIVEDAESLDHRLLRNHRFALVAAEQRDQLPPNVMVPSVWRGPLADSADLMPGLIALDRLTAAQLEELMDQLQEAFAECRAPLLSALLETDASAERVIAHIESIQLQSGPRGERAWLRVHDPRVWTQLPRIFESSRLRAFFGPMTAWSVCLGGVWSKTTPPADANPSAGLNTACHRPAEWAALERIGIVNRVLVRSGWMSHADIVEHSATIDALIVRGQSRHGFTSVTDLVEYAILGLTIHPRFDAFPIARRAIEVYEQDRRAGNKDGDTKLIDELLAITPEQWVHAVHEAASKSDEEAK